MTTSISNEKANFETASRYLISLTQTDSISEECGELKNCVTELDPSDKHYPTLSEHRKTFLETKIVELFKSIEMKLHPIHLRPSEIIQKKIEAVCNLANQLPMPSPKALQKAIKSMHPDLKQNIYYAIWLASGASPENRFSEEKLQTDPGILQRKFPGFFAPVEGTLLEQIALELTTEHQRAVYEENIDALQKISQDLATGAHVEEIKKEILALAEEVQNTLFEEAARLNLCSDIYHSKITILEDPNLLRGIKDPLLPDDHIVDQFARKLRRLLDQLTQLRDDQKVAIFQARLKEPKMNHYQMQALFETLSPAAKVRVQQPPYYGRGFDPELYKTLGAHYNGGNRETTFRVYAPNASDITLNLTAWGHIEHSLHMAKKVSGIWEVQTKHAPPGRSYHFMIVGKNGGPPFKKVDPFAFGNIIHSREPGKDNHESMVRDIEKEIIWTDVPWMADRVKMNPAKDPMAIYEVHPPTWKKKTNGDPLNWQDLALELGIYCKNMGYTHVELMALFEHPQPISMGYQITSFFTLNSEMGSIEDFQIFVNQLHELRMGVIADWVPAHFAIDPFALGSFDGSPLFEDDDPQFAMHPQWGTYEFDFKKQYTWDFLGSNLNFFLKKFHLDGIRVDAVQSMLNLNYGRPGGARLNVHGDGENLDAKAFLRNINTYIHKEYPGTLMIAEEAMGFSNLTRPVTERGNQTKTRGVGFDLAWHMGFMHNALGYFSTSPYFRNLAYSIFTATVQSVDYNEDSRPRGKVILPFSHDENANGKGTIFTKMGGNSNPDKFANGRLLLAYQLLRGGGPILDFMGNEILQTEEWHGRLIKGLSSAIERKKAAVQWEELDPHFDANARYHRGAQESRKVLLHLYHNNPGLHDQTDAGISWIDAKDSEHCVLSFHRRGRDHQSGRVQQFACIFNSSDKDLNNYEIPLPDSLCAPELDNLIGIREVYNTDDIAFGGLGRKNTYVGIICDSSTSRPTHLKLRIAPFSALLLEEQFS